MPSLIFKKIFPPENAIHSCLLLLTKAFLSLTSLSESRSTVVNYKLHLLEIKTKKNVLNFGLFSFH